MGRTLFYTVRREDAPEGGDKPFRAVELLQAQWNRRFTWTCEPLRFKLTETMEHATDQMRRDDWAFGFTKVRDDEYGAYLVAAFAAEASRALPGTDVRLYDEGDYVLPRVLLFRDGRARVDRDELAEHLEPGSSGKAEDPDGPRALTEGGIAISERGPFFASVPLEWAEDHPEVAALLKGNPRLREWGMTVDHAAPLLGIRPNSDIGKA